MKEKTFSDLGLDNGDDFFKSLGIDFNIEEAECEDKEKELKINEIKRNV